MADATPYNMDAVQGDGFVDFYKLLAVPQGAATGEVQERIQALYSEAQANRDHRNLNKRRDYQSLLEYLPHARTVLLDPAKRVAYDDYSARVASGNASTNFSTFLGQLSGTLDSEERTDVLGVQDGRVGSKNVGGSKGSAPKSGSPSARQTPSGSDGGGVARRQPQVSGAKSGPPVVVIAVVVVVILLILFFVLKPK